ncbi:hypothetical protein [Streptomonospora salina]|uniref:Uncharacterized protein n=1 Tax=Streptomonospora salina TaxID=104205 RepID=A0A841E8C4_9ACTN|nr:hypothetical protein [Streptomonospora salina]MBB6000217.1 hypothetical protein [Streptomonospora salina]
MARIRMDQSAIGRLARDVEFIGPELELAARRVALEAKKNPPGDQRTKPFTKRITQTRPRVEGDTACVHVGSSWSLAHLWEFGSINTPPLRPISRAARSAGLRLEGE